MKTEVEEKLEQDGVYTVNTVFDIIKGFDLKDVAIIKIYQYGSDKRGFLWNASIELNYETFWVKDIEEKLFKKVKDFVKSKNYVINCEGKSLQCSETIKDEIEDKVKKIIPIKQMVGSHQIINALMSY